MKSLLLFALFFVPSGVLDRTDPEVPRFQSLPDPQDDIFDSETGKTLEQKKVNLGKKGSLVQVQVDTKQTKSPKLKVIEIKFSSNAVFENL